MDTLLMCEYEVLFRGSLEDVVSAIAHIELVDDDNDIPAGGDTALWVWFRPDGGWGTTALASDVLADWQVDRMGG